MIMPRVEGDAYAIMTMTRVGIGSAPIIIVH